MPSRIAKVIAFAAAASGLVATTGLIASSRAATGSLVAAYAFNEGAGSTVADVSGNGNNGTVANATWVAGKYGEALSFNGSSSRVTIPDSASLHLSSAMTLEAWVDPTTTTATWRDVIYKGNDNYYLEGTSDQSGKPGAGGTFGGTVYGSSALPVNTWTHLAVTYDKTTVRLYVNGSQVSTLAATGAIASSTNPLSIGSDALYGQYFSGLIDDVRVYNTALTTAQIQTDMTTPVGGSSDTQPPSTPTGLAISGVGQSSMMLSWNASSDNVGVTGYQLYLGGSQIGTSLTTSYLFSGLTCGTSYPLGVAAVDAAGNASGIATLTQPTAACSDSQPPSTPGTLTATAISSSRVDLSWGAATDNLGVAGYHIERCQGSGCTSFTEIGTPTTTSYSDTSAAANTSYSYRVRANDAALNLGPYSNTAATTTPSPDTQPPSTPKGLAASGVGQTSMTLSWHAASDNVGVTGYWLFRNGSKVGTSLTRSYLYSGLSCGTSYTLGVAAVDAAGNVSGTATLSTATAACSSGGSGPAPVAAYAFDEGSGSTVADASRNGNTGTVANATWVAGKYGEALSFNGSSSRVTIPDSASLHLSSAMTLEAWVDPTTTTATWRDVIYKGNDNYYLEGTSDHSGVPAGGETAAGSIAHTYGAGALPANAWSYLALTYDGSTLRLFVNGTLVASQAKTGSITSSTNPLSIGSDAIYGQYFNGMIDQVRIYNTALPAAQIQTDMTTPVVGGSSDAQPPSVPSGLGVSSAGQTSLALAWSASSDNVGVSGYGVYTNGTLAGSPVGTGYTLTGLVCGTSYTVAVDAFDAAGNRSAKTTITTSTAACPDTQPPSAPGGLVASFVTQSAVTLSWSASSDNVGVVGYDVYRGPLSVGTAAQTSYAFSGLSCGTAYTLGVDAYDAAGNRSTVASLIVVTNACADTSPPSAPANLAESASTSSSITAGWTASSDNVGVTGYRVFVDGSQAGITATTSYTVTGLSCGSSHQVVVDAYDAAGNRSPQTSATMATSSCPAPPPGDTTSPTTPTGLGVSSAGQTSLALSWNASSDNVGVTGYGVYTNGTLAASSAGTSYTLTGLSCGTSYTVAVDAFDAAGNRSAKATITTSTAACPDTQAPTVPSGVTLATRTATSISISWTASTDNVGVAGYDLYRAGSAVGTATTTSYTFTGLTCNTNYTLAVDAYDAAGNKSAQATTAIATSACPDTTPPSTPTGLATSAVGQTSLTLAWTASSDNVGVTGYRLYIGGSQVGTSTSTSYGFSGLTCGTSYTLGVAAVDAAGNVSSTATVSIQTSACSGGGGATANVFVSPAGSDSGLNCKRFATAQAFPSDRTTVCQSLQKAYALAACGDAVLVGGGSYGGQSISYVSGKDSCSSSTRVKFNVASGEAVTFTGRLTLSGVRHLYLSGSQGSWSVNGGHYGIGVGWSGSGSWPNSCGTGATPPDDIVIDSVTTHWLLAICSNTPASGVGSISNVTVQNSDIGNNDGCFEATDGSEDTMKLRYTTNFTLSHDYIHDLYWSSNCGPHSDGIQMEGGNTNTVIDGNTFVRCGDDCLFVKPDFGVISGLTVTNNVFGSPANDICDYWNTGGSCGPGAVAIGSGTANCKFLNNSIATAQLDILCSGTDLVASNLFGSGVTFYSNIDCSSSSTTALYNASVGSNTCGSHATANATPKWPDAAPNCTNPSPSPSCKPDMSTGSGSSNVIDKGSSSAGQYPTSDMNGTPRPMGAASDAGAYETG